MDSFFEYKNQIIQTGDAVKCIYNGHNINEAKVYICSCEEMIRVAGAVNHFKPIIFICNNERSSWNPETHIWNPNLLGYKFAIGTGLLESTYFGTPFPSWSDGVTKFEKVEKDKLKEVIDQMILKDKLSIEGVYKS
jgi:hypothetical protein